MKAIAILLIASACLVAAAPLAEQEYQFLFGKWVEQFDRQYEAKDFFGRYDTFKTNLNRVIEHNSKNLGWTMAMNEFGDLTPSEFKAKMTGLKAVNNYYARAQNTDALPEVSANTTVDWRKANAVTPVKNQGQCGSCWAFSVTGSVEGAWAIKKNSLVSVSEQQLVDCAGSTGNDGCNGGLMDYGFEWIIQNKGICSESDYPYKAVDQTCQKTCKNKVTISGYKDVASGNENALLAAAAIGPVSVAIEADQSSFQFYSGGVFSDSSCGTQLDHGVLVVGYGTDSGKDYWIVKNSWGTSWGEAGYIRMIRGKNQCGISAQPSYPVV